MHAVMSGINLVYVLLFIGSLHAPSVTAGQHGREGRSTRDVVLALTEQLINVFVANDVDAVMDMFHEDAYLSIEGIPLAHGKEEIRDVEVTTAVPIKKLDFKYIEVAPDEEGADYVYVLFTEDWYNKEDKLFGDKKVLLVWRNTEDGYKVSFLMLNSNV